MNQIQDINNIYKMTVMCCFFIWVKQGLLCSDCLKKHKYLKHELWNHCMLLKNKNGNKQTNTVRLKFYLIFIYNFNE